MLTEDPLSPNPNTGITGIQIYQDPSDESDGTDHHQRVDLAENLFDQLSKDDLDFSQIGLSQPGKPAGGSVFDQLSEIQSRQLPVSMYGSEEPSSSDSYQVQHADSGTLDAVDKTSQQKDTKEIEEDTLMTESQDPPAIFPSHDVGESTNIDMTEENTDQGPPVESSESKYTVTLSEGYSFNVYKRLRKRSSDVNTLPADNSRQYYGVPIHHLLQQLEDNESLENQPSSRQKPKLKPLYSSANHMLSEKWRPKKWLDLMGSEKTNRAMMSWLISWNEFVFENSREPKEEQNAFKMTYDDLGRPQKKILLVHGPPGIGKTSVAHIIAKQAGYSVLEINASDERSADAVQGLVQTATDNHRIGESGTSHKPVCVIADEIEGAAENGFIRSLINMIQADQRAVHDYRKSGGGGSKKKHNSKLLLRPIIAICNDVYASSLRQLRPYAEIINYPRADNRTVVSRLREICQSEKIPLNSKQLTDMAFTAAGDFRSCLNMIQFGTQGQDSLFNKDVGKSWNKVANLMFRKTDKSNQEDWNDVVADIETCGEYDKILGGCFAVYLKMHYTDDMVCKPGYLGDWLHFYEQLNRGIYVNHNGQLSEYLAHPIQAFRHFFSSTVNVKDQHINSDLYELFEKTRESKLMIKDFASNCSTSVRQSFDEMSILLELIPSCLSIISPVVGPSSSFLRTTEKQMIDYATDIMIETGLRFFREKLDNGTTVLRLDPPIERLAAYDHSAQDNIAVGKYIVRRAILDNLLKRKDYKEERGRGGDDDFERVAVDKRLFHASGLYDSKDKEKSDGSSKKKPKQKAVKTDFFGREVEAVKPDGEQNISPSQALENHEDRLWIQYFEGFSNAVKKDLNWASFWAK